jgi:hypothetical protein
MAFKLITRVVKSGVVSLEYLPLAPLTAGSAHPHLMPAVGPLFKHGHTSAIDPAILVPEQYVEDHVHDLAGFKKHTHQVVFGDHVAHSHDSSATTHKHEVRYESKIYKYSVTHITGTDEPVVTEDVGASAAFYVPKADGALSADTTSETIDVALRECRDFANPTVAESELDGEQTVDGTTGPSTAPIYARYEIGDAEVSAVGTGGQSTSSDMHKGVIGASPTVKVTTDGENNKLVQVDSEGKVARYYVTGAYDPGINALYTRYLDTNMYDDPTHSKSIVVYPHVINISTIVNEGADTSYLNVYYKTSLDDVAGGYSNYQHNDILTVTNSTINPPSVNLAGNYVVTDGHLVEYDTWAEGELETKIQFEDGTGFVLSQYDYGTETYIPKFKKVTTEFWNATGEYVGVAPVTGSVIVTSTPITGNVKAKYETPPTIKYSQVQAFNPLPHEHDLTATPTFSDLTHDHIGTADYIHSHGASVPTHTHEFTTTVVTDHTHNVEITDHSHEPVLAGIWDHIDVLSNVTFVREDELSPWVLDSVDTVSVPYPRPTVGAEVADVEWPVGKAEDVVLVVESSAPLITAVNLTSALAVGTGANRFVTGIYTIPDIPYESDAYVAGSPEVAWQAVDKTVAATHIGVIGAVAGTDEQKSLVSPYDELHQFLAREDDGVLVRVKCGKLPSGVAHSHTYTNIIYNLPDHGHALRVHGHTVDDWYLPYNHTHELIYGYPHTHPDLTGFDTSTHTHGKISCDDGKHTHDVNFKFLTAWPYASGIKNVVGDTFNLIWSTHNVLCPDLASTDLTVETGVAIVEEADRFIGHVIVSGTINPDMTGSYQTQGDSLQYWHDGYLTPPTAYYMLVGVPDVRWGLLSPPDRVFEKAWDAGNPVGTYTPTEGTGTPVVSLYDGMSIVSVSNSNVASINPYFATATLSGYTTVSDDPLYSGSADPHPVEAIMYAEGGAVSVTMSGVVADKMHSGV